MTTPQSDLSILFLGKANDAHSARALEFCRLAFANVSGHLGAWGDPLPAEARDWKGDVVVSYLSRWIVKPALLERASVAAINFHPASPDYPGIGCNNFALYDDADEYGVTCHHMAPTVDTGAIIAVRRFPIYANDDVASLLGRTYDVQLGLFLDVMGGLARGEELPSTSETWTRRPYTRVEFNRLFVVRPEMPEDEVRRRVRALSFGPYQPEIVVAGHVFKYDRRADE